MESLESRHLLAAAMLLDALGGGAIGSGQALRGELVVRGSTAPPGAS